MFLPPRDPLVATFSETRPRTSRKYVAQQDIAMPNWSKTFQTFWSYTSVFASEKHPKNLNFRIPFTSGKDPLLATFNETRAPTSRKDLAEQGIVMPNWLKTFQTFWLHSSVFPLEKQPKNLNFHNVFTFKRHFGSYFQ